MAALTRGAARPLPWLAGALTLSCVVGSPISIEALPGPQTGTRIARIAFVGMSAAPGARGVEAEGPGVVSARVVEAFAMRGDVDFVGPAEVGPRLSRRGLSLEKSDPRRIGAELAQVFGADAVLFGVVHHYSSRLGGKRGATRPGFVWFELELRTPGGERIWAGTYRENQPSLAEDLFSLPRAVQRGFVWLDSPALAAYGARELIASLAEERRKWR